jgi:hypothetical protein
MSFKKRSEVIGFGPHQMTGEWAGFMTDDGSGETGVAVADVIAGDDPEEGETGVTDLQDSDRPNENRTSRIQDKVIPFFISPSLSPGFELIHCFRITKTLTSTPCFIKGTSNAFLLSMRALNCRNGIHLFASIYISC